MSVSRESGQSTIGEETNLGAARHPRRSGRATMLRAALASVVVLAAVGAIAFGLSAPVDAPDTSSPAPSNYVANVDAWNWIGQTFVARRDNLDGISLVLATEQVNDYSSIDFVLRDGGPDGQVLRNIKKEISAFPEGSPFDYRPGSLGERWTTFVFDPIEDSAGRSLYFELKGKYLPPDNRVRTLMSFPGKYPAGAGYVNGEVRNAHVVFRSYSIARGGDWVQVIAENLTARKTGLLSNVFTYGALGIAYLIGMVSLGLLGWRALRTDS